MKTKKIKQIIKSSDRLKQEIDNEQICSSFNRLHWTLR